MQLHVYHGPNLIMRHAAAVGEFNLPPGEKKLAPDKARNFFGHLFPDQIVKRISFPQEDVSFECLVALLTEALLNHPVGQTGLPVELKPVDTGASCIIVGFSGVRYKIATKAKEARAIAKELGYPVVVKPVDLGRNRGVTSGIENAEQLEAALKKARNFTRRGLIIEKHIPGDLHRLTVVGGKLIWAMHRTVPQVEGNGVNTVAELIELENQERAAENASGAMVRLVPDSEMCEVIASQGLALADCPSPGQTIRLGNMGGHDAGGKNVDCSARVHPDNRGMAEVLARSFFLDATGIDFITEDISKSWRELDCGIIELNTTPGMRTEDQAAVLLADKFPPGSDGRIPSIVLVGVDENVIDTVAALIQANVDCVGQTTGTRTKAAGAERFSRSDVLPARVLGLILDMTLEALVIGTSVQEIGTHGFPLDQCNLAFVADWQSLSHDMQQLVTICSHEVVRGVDFDGLEQATLNAVSERTVGVDG